jgi:ankyrin repeat protein
MLQARALAAELRTFAAGNANCDHAIDGITLLGAACQCPCASVAIAAVRVILEHGEAAVSVFSEPTKETLHQRGISAFCGWTAGSANHLPLKLAAVTGHLEVVSTLLEASADPSMASGPIHRRLMESLTYISPGKVRTHTTSVVEVPGASASLVTAGKGTLHAHVEALYTAIQFGHVGVVSLLVAHGAKPSADVLCYAAYGGFTASVVRLVELGASLNAGCDFNGVYGPALIQAVRGRHFDTVRAIVGLGAAVDCTGNNWRNRSEHTWQEGDQWTNYDQDQWWEGGTAVAYAAAANDVEMVNCLADLGANLNDPHPSRPISPPGSGTFAKGARRSTAAGPAGGNCFACPNRR